MRSWDFFDTLMGRACGEPWRVFELMGGDEFKRLRQHAEQKSDKTFEGIYASLKQITGWSAEKIDDLYNAELDWERRLAFPIRENTSQVQPGDMVITDTYFAQEQIRDLADRIALPAVDIIASYGGKHHGTVWKDLRTERRSLAQHTGDNRRADYDQARRFGFTAIHYRAGEMTGPEKTLVNNGHWDVAGLSRCVRLQNPYTRPDHRWSIWNKQAQYNVPFLLLCAARLKQYVDEHNYQHVWFLSRDTCLLQRVFTSLYPQVPAATFYASRQTYEHPSASFTAYAQQAAQKPGAVFVDLQGTGKSVQSFTAQTKIRLPYLYCAIPAALEAHVPSLYRIRYIGTELEVLNYDVQGRVIDVQQASPVRDLIEYNQSMVEAAHLAVECLLRHVYQLPSAPQEQTMQGVFAQIRTHAPRMLVRQHQVHHPIRRLGK